MLRVGLLVLALLPTVQLFGIKPDLYYKNQLAIGPCIAGKCPEAFMCENSRCRPDMSKMQIIGPCINYKCPESYSCHEDECIRPPARKREGSEAIGPCVNNLCPDKHVCEETSYQCFPQIEINFP
ncbi:unnamed protein product [Auanema sp. JU1783]|nr:unnamed protein product [Auanema sp. JU1783]